ncbi:hypothetical protein COBT_002080 [Conglomerata obtusa]
MKNGIEVEYTREKGFFLINPLKIKISFADTTKEIPIANIVQVQVRDSQIKNSDANNFHLKIKLINDESHIISYKNIVIRDTIKTFILNMLKYKSEELKKHNDAISKGIKMDNNKYYKDIRINSYLSKMAESHEMISLDNSKSSVIEYLISNPVMLSILDEMNCTLVQFFNYFKQSYFYDIKNTKNVIDRLLNEKLRNYTPPKDSYATRLNNFSFLSLNEKEPIVVNDKIIEEKPLDFTPIFAHNKTTKKLVKKDFKFPTHIKLEFNVEPVTEEINVVKEYDKNILKKLGELCKLAYKCDPSDITLKNNILKEAEPYQEFLKDPKCRGFNPLRYFKKE